MSVAAAFLKGLAFGFLLAATVGPLWILCFRRTLAHGRLFGFVSGMGVGVATADALYGFVAAFGLTTISNFLLAQKFWLSVIGGVFLCWLEIKTLLSSGSYAEASLVVLGVVLGSASWWILLSLGAGWLRTRSGPRLLFAINVVAGVSILAFGAHTLGILL